MSWFSRTWLKLKSKSKSTLTIDLYTRCWNDAHMLPFFFKHYDPIVRKYVVFDDGSTDDSLAILKRHPKVEVRPMPTYADPESRIISSLALQQENWKESRGQADWVIVTDIDEFIWHPDLPAYLREMQVQGVTVIPAMGFNMIGDHMPEVSANLTDAVIWGAPSLIYSKINIFSPTAIDDMQFTLGRHQAKPLGHVQWPLDDRLLLLHYKLVDYDRVLKRHAQYLTRQRSKDIQNQWGVQYTWDAQRLLKEWHETKRQAVNIKTVTPAAWEHVAGKKWWADAQQATSTLSGDLQTAKQP